jgi:DNA repair protein RadD
VHRKAYAIQRADLVLVDEVHLVPRTANTSYRHFLGELSRINPQLKIIGLTATPYRLDSGVLHTGPEALFDDIAFEVSVRELIDQGYLAPLVSKQTSTQLDVSGVATRGGEFIAGQLEAAVDQDPITQSAIDEVVAYGQDRRSWLLFCAGVDHARHVCEAIRVRGVSCATIFGDTPKAERDRIIAAFKRGEVRALASMGVLTTGFNAPAVDLIAMLRPTKSTGLYVQMAGRGTRLAAGKDNCLVLDFAGNVARHGLIDIVKPRDKLNGEGDGEAPSKACPACRTINALAARVCIECDYVFPAPEVQPEATATTRPILSVGRPEWVDVDAVTYHRHEKPGRPPSLRVDYHCGLVRHREWVCLEHGGHASQKAAAWWRRRDGSSDIPASVDDALARADELRQPVQIAVRPHGRFMEVVHARFA